MCVVSNIGQAWTQSFPQQYPNIQFQTNDVIQVSKADFNRLEAEIKELKILLKAAKEYDKKTGQPDCEMEDKVKFIRMIAELVDVDLGEIFASKEEV